MLSTRTRVLLFLLFFLSGATGLVYELVWTRQLIFVFGGTTYAITTVLVAFMGGLGLGSYLAGRLSRRLTQPGVAYGVLEIAIGLYALAVPLLLSLAEPAYRAIYPLVMANPAPLTAARFVVGALVLLLPATLMGATLPLLVRYLTAHGGLLGRNVAVLYGTNSLGAVTGVLASGFLLIPALGLANTTELAAAANILIGIIGVALFRQPSAAAAGPAPVREAPPASQPFPPALRRAALAVFAVSGFAAMVYQVAWTRSLVTSLGSSTYSFTCILAAFILGIALGSFGVARMVDRYRNPPLIIGGIQLALGFLAVLILPVYGRIPYVAWVLATQYGAESYDYMLVLQFLFIILITLAPTILLGAMFPLVTRTAVAGARDEGAATGRAYGANTLGTILGAFTGGFVLLATIGVHNSVIVASLLNGLSGAVLLYLALPRGAPAVQRAAGAGAAFGVVALFAMVIGLFDAWNPLITNSGGFLGNRRPGEGLEDYQVLYYDEGVDLNVMVAAGRQIPDDLFLTVNGKTDASTGFEDMQTQILTGHIPALIAPQRDKVCVIGLGCGMTLGSLGRHAEIKQIDCVEISEGVIAGAGYFDRFTYDVLDSDPRVRLFRADGRNHLLLTDQRYDLIVSQPSNPWIAGVSNLFTKEYFELCRDRLSEDGTLYIWMQGYHMSDEHFRLVVHTLAQVFEHVGLWEMTDFDFGLIARRTPPNLPLSEFQRRFNQPPVRADLYRVGRGRLASVLGGFTTSGAPLREWAAGPRIHTDDNAILEFAAPRQLYTHESPKIFSGLLEAQRSIFDEAVHNDLPPEQAAPILERLAGFRDARRIRFAAEIRHSPADPLPTLAAALEAYRRDPGNMMVYDAVRTIVVDTQRRDPQRFASDPRFEQVLAGFNDLPLPSVAERHGMELIHMAGRLELRGGEMMAGGHWDLAETYLTEARELAPHIPDIIMKLAVAQAEGGDLPQAIETLRDGIARDVLELDALEQSPPMKKITESAEYAQLKQELGG